MTSSNTNPFRHQNLTLEHYQASRRAKADKVFRLMKDIQPNIGRAASLDIGCYDGCMTHQFASHLRNIVGVDIDESALSNRSSEFNANNLSFVCYDGSRLPFGNHSFDLVIINHVLYYVADQRDFLAELGRVMTADGIAYLSLINGHYARFVSVMPTWPKKVLAQLIFGAPPNFGRPVGGKAYRQLLSAFRIRDITYEMLKRPHQYGNDFRGWRGCLLNVISKMPDRIIKIVASLSPTYIFVLHKR